LLFKSTGDAADPEEHAPAEFRRDFSADDDIGDGETATGAQDAEGFAENAIFVSGEVDDTVRDDDIDGVVREWNVLDLSLEEFDVCDAGLALVFAGKGEHFVCHVETVGFACGADAFGGEEHVNSSTRAEVEDNLSRIEVNESCRVAAAEGGEDGFLREFTLFRVAIEVFGDGVAAAEGGIAAGLGTGIGYTPGDGTVLFANDRLSVHELHSLTHMLRRMY
jgi:hypothetical protein